jgi:hypothetical protein
MRAVVFLAALQRLGNVIYWTAIGLALLVVLIGVLMAVTLSSTLSRLRVVGVKLRTYEITNIPQRHGKLIYWTGSAAAVVCSLFGAIVGVTATANGMTTDETIFVAASFMAAALIYLAALWIADKSS